MPFSETCTTTDVDKYRAMVRPVNGEFLARGSEHFAGTVIKIDLHRLRMQRLEESLPRTWRFEIPSARSAICFSIASGSRFSSNGVELQPTEIVLLGPATIHWNKFSAPSQFGSMSLPAEDLAELSTAVVGRDLTPPRDAASLTVSPPAMAKLQRLHVAACQLAETAPEIITNAEAARGLEQALIGAMFACLDEGEVHEDTASRRRHNAIIERFRALAEENAEQSLYLSDVCSAIGVTHRTLHVCCQEHLGMGPKRYLMLRRMDLARQALLVAAAAETTVTRIATQFGFWEFGRFAVVSASAASAVTC